MSAQGQAALAALPPTGLAPPPTADELGARVRAHAIVARPWLCPELQLHLVTDACPLWRASERDLAALGLSDPYWAFAWAGGQALARYLLDHPAEVRGARVLDVGAGGGVEAIAAARAGAREVVATDLDPIACAALHLNAALNGVTVSTTTRDVIGEVVDCDVLLLGDVCYDAALAARVWPWLDACAGRGTRVLVGDPGRGHVPADRLQRVWVGAAPSDVDVDGRWLRDASVFALGPRKCE